MLSILEPLLSELSGVDYGEIRIHERKTANIAVRNKEIEGCSFNNYSGTGVRAMLRSGWGFSSTNRTDEKSIKKAIIESVVAAKASQKGREAKLSSKNIAKGKFEPVINDHVSNHTFEEKLELVKKIEEKIRKASDKIISASCSYREIIDKKYIVTSDGARAEISDVKPEFRVYVLAKDGSEMADSHESIGVTGGWKDLFEKNSADEIADIAIERALKLLKAKYPKGEKTTVILDPAIVGLIAHEAIGHTVEADFVMSGAITNGKIGKKVASEYVTLADSGPSQFYNGASGTIFVDDEGIITQKTIIIDKGILKSYLHNRESASFFGVEPTGNARAFEYTDEPIIRMRNTYIEPGLKIMEEIISEVKEGYLLKGAVGGQADANAEFMFGVQEAYKITNGKIGDVYKGVTISGQAFDVLSSVDAVSKDFKWGLGSGYCGKGQQAKVDAGGPYLRCKAIIGGRQ